MAPPPEQNSSLTGLAARLLAGYLHFVHRSSDVVLDPPDIREKLTRAHPYILAMWHGQFGMMPALHIGEYRVSAIAARHGDAEVLAKTLARFNIELVRGAGANGLMRRGKLRDVGGVHALRSAIKLLKGGSTFALTADVPPGPPRVSGEGIVTLARLSGRPIIPFAVASSRFLTLRTWSRMTINLPYSKLAYVIGEPIHIPGDADMEALGRYRTEVDAALNAVTARAYQLAGADVARIAPPPWVPRRKQKLT